MKLSLARSSTVHYAGYGKFLSDRAIKSRACHWEGNRPDYLESALTNQFASVFQPVHEKDMIGTRAVRGNIDPDRAAWPQQCQRRSQRAYRFLQMFKDFAHDDAVETLASRHRVEKIAKLQ